MRKNVVRVIQFVLSRLMVFGISADFGTEVSRL
jgi:hypothetical protein